ncbi:MAG: TonB-dependent receptor [Chitinophagaceae bacterium]|nr:TonB-dependent receptor [Chitinophagaceae bacterium]MBL0306229.1 TonB-dependent receptor [Chitinophagaceae bacterium]HQV84321.1 TonB-dependent receptor [Chitinophagaceae bacterium]HQX71587.1 TonB-dependent receptor [Chitinophagaceae bacterium]HQZ74547.1 TonB-dependent receptor [Chitinophagaceae bacterium]
MKKTARLKKLFFTSRQGVKPLLLIVVLLMQLLTVSQQSFAQNVTVRGKITKDDGQPLSGASVVVKGTTNGTTSNEQGNFLISAPGDATLVISSIDFTSREIKVNNQSTINVTLSSADKTLGEVIVVGYGTQRKEAITGSVASINGDKMREVPSPNVTQALQGRLAGVEISQTSTRPGATMQIRIRGIRSLSADNNPLIVLDGIPFIGSLADINPNDVKSIEVLKDASATAIYGSRGANGVLLITTDKGSKNRKPRINYSTYVGSQSIFAKYPMMNGPQFVALRAARGQYANGQDEANDVNTDWQDLFYKTGIVTDHNVSLSGGSEAGSYNFGMGYYLNQGIIPTQQYKRYSLRGSIDQQVGKYFRFGFTTNNNYNESQGNQVGLYNSLSMSPISTPYNPDGSMKRIIRMAADDQFIFTKDVVEQLKDNDQWLNEDRGFASYNAIYGEVKAPFLDGLKYRVNLGLDYVQFNNGAYTGQGVGSVNPASISSASVDNRFTYHWTLENLLTYDHTFGGKHTVNAVALYSAEQNKYNRSNMSAQDIPADAFQFYNLGQAAGQLVINPANQDYQLWGLKSAMGRVMYSYDNRYMISATVRSDGSSRLAPGKKWHTYPALSVGWNIAKESFMQNITAINTLKLRVGFGQTSNQAIAPYSTLGRLDTRPYNFGPSTYSTGFYVSQLPNVDLGWEFSKTLNFGLDFSAFKNRLSGTIEYYITKTEDILLGLSLPPTSGVSGYTANIGSTQNKGFELSLNGTIINNVNGWTWEAGVNFYTNNNKLVSLASGQTRDEANWWFVGHNINAIYDYKKIGLWTDAKDSADNYLNILEPGGTAGMIKVLYTGDYDANGRPVRAIGPADRQIMDVDPDFQGGFNTRVAYKGFDLGIVGIYRSGGILFSTIHGSNGYLNLLTGRRNNINVDYWTPTNTGAKYPNPAGPISNDNPRYASTLSYFDGSFMKIRTITLGYDLSRSLIKNPNINMRMYFTAQNPFVMFSPFHKESGLDPETNSFGNENAAVNLSQNLRRILTVGFNTPSTRNYIVGVNLTF